MEHVSGLEDEDSIQEMIPRLYAYLNDWSDEIPEERIMGARRFKVRGSWFVGASSNILLSLEIFLTDEDLEQRFNTFWDELARKANEADRQMVHGERPDSFTPTTREEIDTMNAFLKEVIEKLERKR